MPIGAAGHVAGAVCCTFWSVGVVQAELALTVNADELPFTFVTLCLVADAVSVCFIGIGTRRALFALTNDAEFASRIAFRCLNTFEFVSRRVEIIRTINAISLDIDLLS